jgi:hypothetical protein
MILAEREQAQNAICAFLSGKVLAVESALDEMPDLRIINSGNEKSIQPSEYRLRVALEGYKMGVHSNALAKQKPNIYASDSLISHILSRLSWKKCLDSDDIEKVQEHLEKALDMLLDVYSMEERRSRVFQRMAKPLPKNSPK